MWQPVVYRVFHFGGPPDLLRQRPEAGIGLPCDDAIVVDDHEPAAMPLKMASTRAVGAQIGATVTGGAAAFEDAVQLAFDGEKRLGQQRGSQPFSSRLFVTRICGRFIGGDLGTTALKPGPQQSLLLRFGK